MTVENTAIKAVALGNGATVVWPYTFPIPAAEYVVVTLVDVDSGNETPVSPANYSITGIGTDIGGTVTYPLSGSPLTNATYIVIERLLTLTQETDLENQGAVYPSAIEAALDYLTMVTQQLQDQLDRAIIFSVADTVDVTLPTASARAGMYLAFNSNGDPIAAAGLAPSVTVSAAMIPVVTAPTTADALTALGIPGSLLNALIPAGTVWDYAGTVAPAGFLLCFGSACTPTYPVLRALLVSLGSPFGTNGVDPLLPDIRSRSVVGKSNMGGVDNGLWGGGSVLGAVAGNQAVVLGVANLPSNITSSNTGVINLSVNTGLVNTLVGVVASSRPPGGGAASDVWTGSIANNLPSVGTLAIGAVDVTSNNTGGGQHENRHPGIILSKIIKAH